MSTPALHTYNQQTNAVVVYPVERYNDEGNLP